MKRGRNEHLQASVSQYLRRRQFPVLEIYTLKRGRGVTCAESVTTLSQVMAGCFLISRQS